MGSLFSSSTSEESNGNYTTQVFLNVYDLTPLNNYTYCFGLGIFHSGIEVHGLEYGFGAHEFPTSGVFEVEPKCCPGFIYRCSISLGKISMSPSEFREFMENLAAEYHGDTYHLIAKNCNHFTDEVCLKLTGRGVPRWVNRLARLGALCSCLLPESLQLPAVKQIPEYHVCSGNAKMDWSLFQLLPRASQQKMMKQIMTNFSSHLHLQAEKWLLSKRSRGTGERHDSKVSVLVNKVNVQVKEMPTDKVGALTITRTN
ncbi:hypothetical protein MRB53_017713 [Persea americana]|uniref:Uncharacterized protein n=1 Tax=Persea americana TaxID=3435 RepID=A0ACC2M5S3_PERAE|nr:hypothetical protein MRB53_017713 [Persea americana]